MPSNLISTTAYSFKDSLIANFATPHKNISKIAIYALGFIAISFVALLTRWWCLRRAEFKTTPIVAPNKTESEVGQAEAKLKVNADSGNSMAENLIIRADKVKVDADALKVKEKDFSNLHPKEMSLAILSHLNAQDLAKCQGVNKKCQVMASHEALWKALTPKIAFGKEQWAKYFGDVGKEPPLPKEIHKILKSPCPFFSGKTVEQTHMLVLIPETVDGKPLNLETLGKLVKAPTEGHATQYDYFTSDDLIRTVGKQAKSHWVLMTKDVIGANMSDSAQQALIKKGGMNYEFPKVLDAAVCIFINYVSTQERLFNDDPCTYTRCQEQYVQDCQVAVGKFSVRGLNVNDGEAYAGVALKVGVAPLRKFS